MALKLVSAQPRKFENVPVDETFKNLTINEALDHNGANVGFYGAAPAVKPTALTAASAAAPAGGTGASAGAWSTAADRDLAIATINNTQTRLNELETKLRALGLIT